MIGQVSKVGFWRGGDDNHGCCQFASSGTKLIQFFGCSTLGNRDDDVIFLQDAKAAVESVIRRYIKCRSSADREEVRGAPCDRSGGAAAGDQQFTGAREKNLAGFDLDDSTFGEVRRSCERRTCLLQKPACHTCIGNERGDPVSSQGGENGVCLLQATCDADDLRNSTKLLRIYG
jgi:hypothetical protein